MYLFADEYGDSEPIHRFATVTSAGEFVYVKAQADTWSDAIQLLGANVTDSLYSESPVGLLDLDTGEYHAVRRVEVVLDEMPTWHMEVT